VHLAGETHSPDLPAQIEGKLSDKLPRDGQKFFRILLGPSRAVRRLGQIGAVPLGQTRYNATIDAHNHGRNFAGPYVNSQIHDSFQDDSIQGNT
jgi:hypothetical protein